MFIPIVLISLFVVLGVWIFASWRTAKNIEEPSYQVLEEKNGYEIRQYEKMLLASVEVEGDFRKSLSAGFAVLGGYIFGNNVSSQKISMTAPVTEQKGKKIAMTAPVTQQDGEKTRITFTMPSEYTKQTLPKPKDSRIQFMEVPPQKRAALKFSWGYPGAKRILSKKEQLLRFLERDGVVHEGEPLYAGFSAPITFPPMFRNEIQVLLSE